MAKDKAYDIQQKNKRKDNLKYLYFSRYLMTRYIVTIFLFVNIFWLTFSLPYKHWLGIAAALCMTLCSAVAAIEQLTKMHNQELDVPLTRKYFWLQLGVNLILLVLNLFPFGRVFFPFSSKKIVTQFISLILIAGIILCLICEWRIAKIRKNQDRYASVIETFKKNH
ncbi:PTS cellobiose transporter subunit IIA [Lactobacillus sp. ESL0684]|uniref:PTS cellobiose transporter subunit IIA n=1 Tax=unclassified Lactobacillus TaxID=2620435 RepID=UPI0023F79C5F|nr:MULTISPECIES: PTS cellobiose transporter subunit IIA [unclassified Lactobacillus]WEV40232.1 PTS cellobiose transporter subunit IIA [Lactobacillus sp. ESL0681]WEV43243.1 PTS cellobiose transporter subunit IIA [Lactobacillus sp. ESL0684]